MSGYTRVGLAQKQSHCTGFSRRNYSPGSSLQPWHDEEAPLGEKKEAQERVWVKFGPLVPLVASTSRHLSEICTWQTLSSQAACAGKGGKHLPRYGGTHLFWLAVEIYKYNVLPDVLGGMIRGPKSQLICMKTDGMRGKRVSCKGLRECRYCPLGRSWCSWHSHRFLLPSSQPTSGLKVHSQLIK